MVGTFSEQEYRRPDMEALTKGIQDYIDGLKNATSFEQTWDLLIAHKEAMVDYNTMRNLASIRNTGDTRDAFYAEEKRFFGTQAPKLALQMKEANEALMNSPFRPQLEEKLGSLFFTNLETQKKLADPRILEDQIQESELVQRYSKVIATALTEFNGEQCNFYGLLKYMQHTDRQVRKAAFESWAALYEKISGELDAIYDEMVHLRHGMAMKLGFPRYTEMAYLMLQRYDYTIEDAARFRETVKKVITPACVKLYARQAKRLGVDKLRYYDEKMAYPEGNPTPSGTVRELVGKAQQMYREMAPEAGEYFDAVVEHEMYDLQSRPGKATGGYCSSLQKYKLPFIFSNFNGTSADVGVLTHEAGHGFDSYLSYRSQPIVDLAFSTSEICEIHSMTMEHFAYPWMHLFFGEDAQKYCTTHLEDSLTTIPYLVSVDEFQHRVFDNPDMTAAERRAVWHEIEQEFMPWRDYDGNEFLAEGGFWMQKMHIFMEPFYYIEYALAQIGAYEFYNATKVDRADAWTRYCRLCRAGGSQGYFKLLELAGLHNPFLPETVETAVAGVLSELGEF